MAAITKKPNLLSALSVRVAELCQQGNLKPRDAASIARSAYFVGLSVPSVALIVQSGDASLLTFLPYGSIRPEDLGVLTPMVAPFISSLSPVHRGRYRSYLRALSMLREMDPAAVDAAVGRVFLWHGALGATAGGGGDGFLRTLRDVLRATPPVPPPLRRQALAVVQSHLDALPTEESYMRVSTAMRLLGLVSELQEELHELEATYVVVKLLARTVFHKRAVLRAFSMLHAIPHFLSLRRRRSLTAICNRAMVVCVAKLLPRRHQWKGTTAFQNRAIVATALAALWAQNSPPIFAMKATLCADLKDPTTWPASTEASTVGDVMFFLGTMNESSEALVRTAQAHVASADWDTQGRLLWYISRNRQHLADRAEIDDIVAQLTQDPASFKSLTHVGAICGLCSTSIIVESVNQHMGKLSTKELILLSQLIANDFPQHEEVVVRIMEHFRTQNDRAALMALVPIAAKTHGRVRDCFSNILGTLNPTLEERVPHLASWSVVMGPQGKVVVENAGTLSMRHIFEALPFLEKAIEDDEWKKLIAIVRRRTLTDDPPAILSHEVSSLIHRVLQRDALVRTMECAMLIIRWFLAAPNVHLPMRAAYVLYMNAVRASPPPVDIVEDAARFLATAHIGPDTRLKALRRSLSVVEGMSRQAAQSVKEALKFNSGRSDVVAPALLHAVWKK